MQGPPLYIQRRTVGNSTYERAPQGPGNDFCQSTQAHGESTSVRATNVTAIADTGAQVNVWSLDEFVKYGFPHDILTTASNLAAANHSSISIVGAFFACRATVMLCNAGPWSTLAPTFRPSFIARHTVDAGSPVPQFPIIGRTC